MTRAHRSIDGHRAIILGFHILTQEFTLAEFLPLQCPKCAARYSVPDVYQPHIQGHMMLCPACRSSWVPMPNPQQSGSLPPSRVDLRKFRSGTDSLTGTGTAVGAGATEKVPVPARPASTPLSLKVMVKGPDGEITGSFDLGSKNFVIGSGPCHLRLPNASIPSHAVEIRRSQSGFAVSGIDGFSLPLGSLFAPSAQVEPGNSVRLNLAPFQLELSVTHTPGNPVKDLAEIARASQPATPQPAAPQPATPQPAAARPQASRPAVSRGMGGSRVEQIQELAAEVRTAPQPFGGPTSLLDEVDGDMTVTDMGAAGFHSQRSAIDPFQYVQVSLELADGPQVGRRFLVTKTPLLIGRADHGMAIRDPRVSSKHAQLDVGGPELYTLKDLASTNGTTVNGRPISITQLKDGDLISFGGMKFTFRAQLKNA